MQNVGFVYEFYMFLILKNALVSFSNHMLLFFFCNESLMNGWEKVILLTAQKSHLSSFLNVLIKTVLFNLFPTIKGD